MNKHNLIKFGAYAQKIFDMKDGFKIMEVASDSPPRIRVAIPSVVETIPEFDYVEVVPFAQAISEIVEFTKVGTNDNFEYIWCGYSRRANTLVIRDTRE